MSVFSPEGVHATARAPPGSRSFNRKDDKAAPARHQWSRMQTMPRPRRGSVRTEPSFKDGEWEVPNGYDYTKPTQSNYAAPAERTGEVYGDYKDVRATRDFDYHGIYSRERQLFQGEPSYFEQCYDVFLAVLQSHCCGSATMFAS